MVERLHPGVYTEESSGGVGAIQPLATSTAAFIGEAARGMPAFPYFLTSFDDYTKALGGHLPGEKGFLAQAALAFFNAGGQRAYAVRVLPAAAQAGTSNPVSTRVPTTVMPAGARPDALRFHAKGAGAWSSAVRIDIGDSTAFPGEAFTVNVSSFDGGRLTPLESFNDVRMDPTSEDYFPDLVTRTSLYLTVEDLLLEDANATVPTKPAVPEQAPTLVFGAPTAGLYKVWQGSALTFRWWNTASDADPIVSTVTFDATAIASVQKSFTNGAVTLTPHELATLLKSALSGSFLVLPDPADPNNATTAMAPSVLPIVATKPYLFLSLPAGASAFNLQGATVQITVAKGTAAAQSFALGAPASAAIGAVDVAALITTANVPGATVTTRGNTVIVAGGHDTTGSVDTLIGVTVTVAGGAAQVFDAVSIPGNPGVAVDSLDTVILSVTETRTPAVPSFLRTTQTATRARGYSEGSAASPYVLPAITQGLRLSGGTDGPSNAILGANDYIGDPTAGTGLHALDHVDVNLVALPGKTTPEFIAGLMTYCDARGDCFAIVDGPGAVDPRFNIDASEAKQFVDGLPNRSENSAVYFPWLEVVDQVGVGKNPTRYVPPSGHVAGIYANTDVTRGVWKAPAGVQAIVSGALDVQIPLRDADQDLLNPVSLNCVRKLTGAGIVSWGARTLASDPQWRYVPVRRTAIFLKSSLRQGLQWAVFEPNDQRLWDQIQMVIRSFMLSLFRQGAFQGSRPDDAFAVRCDASTNPQDLIDQGIVTAQVSFAPLKPAEFVVIEISQKSLVSAS
jgi:phage tail sheath protein FI